MTKSENKVTLLYVDDEEDNLLVFKSAFRRFYNVLIANSAKEGSKILLSNPADIIISDQRMPQLNGVEFLSNLPDEPDSARILLTGFSDIETVIEALNKGKIHRYVTKPWDKDELKDIIEAELSKLYNRRENAKVILRYRQNEFIDVPEPKEQGNTSTAAVKSAIKTKGDETEVEALNRKLDQAYSNMQLLRDIGQDIFSNITVESIIESTYDNVNKLMDATGFGVGIYDKERNALAFPGFIEKGETLPLMYDDLDDKTQTSAWCFNHEQEMVIGDLVKEYNKYVPDLAEPKEGENPESLIYMPIKSPNGKLGVITVQSWQKNAYNNYHLSMLRNIAIFVASALENAQAYEKIELHKDEITNKNIELEQIVEKRTDQLKKQHEELESTYTKVKLLGEIGQQITANLSVESISETVYENVNSLMDASVFGIGVLDKKHNRIEFPHAMEKGKQLPTWYSSLDETDRLPSWCLTNNKEIIINDYEVEYSKYIKTVLKAKVGDLPDSVIYLPLMAGDETIGVITVQSFKKHVYNQYHIDILRSLGSYISIALQNANSYKKMTQAFEQLKSAQTKLVESEKMASLGVLTAGVAHEINNPVNFISGGITSLEDNFAELKELIEKFNAIDFETATKKDWADLMNLKEEISVEELIEEMEQLFKSIKNGVSRTSEIVAGLRNFTRLNESNKKIADLEEGIDSTLVILNNHLKNRIEIVKNYSKIDSIVCFPGQLNQVFMNIIYNAADAIEGNGKITITTTQKNDNVIITIEDTGTGMTEQVRSKIFEPFFTTKGVGKGTGLGLSIVYGIIEKHNGEIQVESEPGKGSKFTISLPIEN